MMTEQGRVLELLLNGAFICQISDEDAWRYLKTSANRDKLEPHLNLLNRTIATAAEGDVFYAAYLTLSENERKVLGSQFQDVSANLMPLVEWLLLVQQANGNDVPVTQGAAIRLTELQSTIEDTPAFAEQLEKISRYRLFGSTSTTLDGQLKQVFRKLTDLGYLLKPNQDKQIFLATGKVEYLYDVIRFIDETEALSLAEQAESAVQQGNLL